MRKTCDNCGAENPPTANFCRQCGKPWSQTWLRSVTCMMPLMQQWRGLRHRMTRKEVRALLGEPARIDTTPSPTPTFEEWVYEYEPTSGDTGRLRGTARFIISEGTLAAWTEPDWNSATAQSS
jgi:hypothetical protein